MLKPFALTEKTALPLHSPVSYILLQKFKKSACSFLKLNIYCTYHHAVAPCFAALSASSPRGYHRAKLVWPLQPLCPLEQRI